MGCVASVSISAVVPVEPPKFEGKLFRKGDPQYPQRCYQYASTSEPLGSMEPAFILYPAGEPDIVKAVNFARENGLAIAVRTGGHQYSGASSTSGQNFQLDLSEAFRTFELDEANAVVRTGISWNLRELQTQLAAKRMFIPAGQCSHVHVGGHVSTGGYGQLIRAFGLFSDHALSVDVITADGQRRVLRRDAQDDAERDLFYAFLGGSPGNYGVLTHCTLRVHRDSDHPHARGIKIVHWFTKQRAKQVLDVLVELANDPDLPPDYDFSTSILSGSQLIIPAMFQTADEKMKRQNKELWGEDEKRAWPPCVVLLAQWSNLKGTAEQFDPKWFNKFKAAAGPDKPVKILVNDDVETPISVTASQHWMFMNRREFLYPYIKRSYLTNQTKALVDNKWTEWMSNRLFELQGNRWNGLKMMAQIQVFGGPRSAFKLNDTPATSFSWRQDTTIGCTLDCFYTPSAQEKAIKWQSDNDQQVGHPDAVFCPYDRRLIWANYGDKDLNKVWAYYYESQEKYQRLVRIKRTWDPHGVFSPNSFCVGGAKSATKPVEVVDVKPLVFDDATQATPPENADAPKTDAPEVKQQSL